MGTILIILIILIILDKTGHIKKKGRSGRRPRQTRRPTEDKWVPEWVWNENTQSWEHVGAEAARRANYRKEPPKQTEPKVEPKAEQEEKSEADTDEEIDYTKSYQKKYLFTKNELYNYKTLKQYADVKGLIICPKVRLLDIIEPIKGLKKYKTLFYKVQAKHVDFVICDDTLHIKAIIELDDSSHDQEHRIERDKFVDEILRSVGYKVIHTRGITYEILDQI